eukprot:3014957-Pyramimonas_sp.AAC.2
MIYLTTANLSLTVKRRAISDPLDSGGIPSQRTLPWFVRWDEQVEIAGGGAVEYPIESIDTVCLVGISRLPFG